MSKLMSGDGTACWEPVKFNEGKVDIEFSSIIAPISDTKIVFLGNFPLFSHQMGPPQEYVYEADSEKSQLTAVLNRRPDVIKFGRNHNRAVLVEEGLIAGLVMDKQSQLCFITYRSGFGTADVIHRFD